MKNAQSSKKTWAMRAGVAGVTGLAIVVGGVALSANAADPRVRAVYDESDNAQRRSASPRASCSTRTPTSAGHRRTASYRGRRLARVHRSADGTSLSPRRTSCLTSAVRLPQTRRDELPADQHSGLGGTLHAAATAEPRRAVATPTLQDGLWWTSKIAATVPVARLAAAPFVLRGRRRCRLDQRSRRRHRRPPGFDDRRDQRCHEREYNGTQLPLGNVDTTPFNQADIDAAAVNGDGTAERRTDRHADLAEDDRSLGPRRRERRRSTP